MTDSLGTRCAACCVDAVNAFRQAQQRLEQAYAEIQGLSTQKAQADQWAAEEAGKAAAQKSKADTIVENLRGGGEPNGGQAGGNAKGERGVLGKALALASSGRAAGE